MSYTNTSILEAHVKMQASYCLGFIFNSTLDTVYLIQKLRPEWQYGKLNGIGGKIHNNENSLKAMIREAKEEVNYEGNWMPCGFIAFDIIKCDVFYSIMKDNDIVQAMTDELIYPILIQDLKYMQDQLVDQVYDIVCLILRFIHLIKGR